jgi:4-cresol dehydrogenase (hydroxylating) flavoprotein subunit
MEQVLPEGVNAQTLDRALTAFADAIGEQWVLNTDQDRDNYQDFYALNPSMHHASAAIAPANAEEVQEIVRIANEYKIPLWTISRGKNFAYGGPAPVLDGCIVLDLTRMKEIQFDEENGVVLVEPGVGFYDLYDYIEKEQLPFWLSVPGQSWGSVMGNALERGVGYTPYGDHAAHVHGLEVVLANGEMIRTGMGAMDNSGAWNLHPYGYGPSWDQMFSQSNFGVVTKMGLWLMPEPESVVSLGIQFDEPDDLGWAIDTFAPMRREGLIQHSPTIGNWLRYIATRSKRSDWYDGPSPFPEEVIRRIRDEMGVGWWTTTINTYGRSQVTRASADIIKSTFSRRSSYSISETVWNRGERRPFSPFFGVPITLSMNNSNWYGGRGGHIDFSPVLPQTGAAAMEQFRRTYNLHNEHGIDYHPGFNLGERHMTNINAIMFDKDDNNMRNNADQLFRSLVSDAASQGYGEYRSHISYMDLIAESFSYNNQGLSVINSAVKDALDPNGILSPGKSGIWPSRYKGEA